MLRSIVRVMAILVWLPLAACADEGSTFQEGTHYVELRYPVATKDPGKIEVMEVFSYACPHCYHFDTPLEIWSKKQSQDVQFLRTPANFNPTYELFAKAYYTAEALDITDKMHKPLFDAIHAEQQPIRGPKSLAKFFANFNIGESEFNNAFKSFGVTSLVQQADARTRSYRITSVPTLIVNGKYRVEAQTAGGQEEMLKVVDYLIAKERSKS